MKRGNSFVKNTTALLIASFLVLSLSGTGRAAGTSGGPMLGEILSKTEANYQKIQAFTATFRQMTTSAAAGTVTPGEAAGRLYYAKPRLMRWEYDKPEQQVFVANNQYAWLYVPGENQISMFDAKKLFASPLAQTFFDGAVGLKNHFDVTLDASQSSKNFAVLKLVPKQEDPSIRLLFLWIDLQTYRISRIESQDILGNTNRITIESLSPHPNLDAKLFQLDAPPMTKIFDAEGREFTPEEIDQLKSKIATGK